MRESMDEWLRANEIVLAGLVNVMHGMVTKGKIPPNKAARLLAEEVEKKVGMLPRWQAIKHLYEERYQQQGESNG